jgi:uncharacterized membrane protein
MSYVLHGLPATRAIPVVHRARITGETLLVREKVMQALLRKPIFWVVVAAIVVVAVVAFAVAYGGGGGGGY